MNKPVALLLLFAAASSAAAVGTDAFPLVKPLAAPEGAARTIGRFALDEDFFDGTEPGFAGMRVIDARGGETPFLTRTVRQRRMIVEEHDIGARIVEFELLPDNRFRLTVERAPAEAPRPAAALVLHSAQKDYEKLVTVESSDDRAAWTPLAEGVAIYDYAKHLDLRRDRVAIAPDARRYYRIAVSNITEEQLSPLVQIARETRDGRLVGEIRNTSLRREDFRIDGVRLIERRETWTDTEAALREYAVRAFAVAQDADRKATVAEFAVRNVPLRELRFEVADVFFSRGVAVEAHTGAEGGAAWRRLAAGRLQRVPGGDPAEGLVVRLPRACRYRRYRVTILNLDSPPLTVTAVKAWGEAQEAVFLCRPGEKYRAVYGAVGAEAPRYDMAEIVAGVKREDMDEYAPGAGEPYAPFRKPGFARLRSGKALLVPAVALMVLVLVWLIAKSAKQVA
ncbi:MAG: DUF3999 domain-containing protein [Lentisphaerae bacterium]|nr:DUF3999 domain-containing protein [Lentisphaerota bacterium]